MIFLHICIDLFQLYHASVFLSLVYMIMRVLSMNISFISHVRHILVKNQLLVKAAVFLPLFFKEQTIRCVAEYFPGINAFDRI